MMAAGEKGRKGAGEKGRKGAVCLSPSPFPPFSLSAFHLPFSLSPLLPFLLLAAMFPLAAAARERVGDVEVDVLPPPSLSTRFGDESFHGCIEYRVQLRNHAKQDRVVHLQIPASREHRADTGTVDSRTVQIAGEQEAIVSLFQSAMEGNRSMEVGVNGVSESKTMVVGAITPGYSRGGPVWGAKPAVLLSRAVPQDFHQAPAPVFRPADPSEPRPSPADPSELSTPDRSTSTFTFLRSALPASQWSPNWLGYSCYDVVLLTAKEAEQLPAEAELALRRFLECGGTLLVHGRKVPAFYSQNAMTDGHGGYFVGLGHAVASGAESETNWEQAARTLDALRVDQDQYPYQKPADSHNLLVAEAKVPVGGMFALVLLFAVGIGPVNVWLLSRYKRRIWLWWNVPAISLLTCLAVFGYSVFSEGWSGHGKIASVTLLDQRTHRATTFGYASYFCPLTPSSGPRFSAETEVVLLGEEQDRYRRTREVPEARHVDWSSDQHLVSGWIRARVPAYFQFRKNEDRRERLIFAATGDAPTVVNALGADIARLYWADASGRVFEGHDIAAGAEKPLAVSGTTHSWSRGRPGKDEGGRMKDEGVPSSFILPPSSFAKDPNRLAMFDRWNTDKDPAHLLIPGSYIAFLKKSPFVEARLDAVRSEDTVAIVCGICADFPSRPGISAKSADFPSLPGISAKSAGQDHGR